MTTSGALAREAIKFKGVWDTRFGADSGSNSDTAQGFKSANRPHRAPDWKYGYAGSQFSVAFSKLGY
jgi:hypothetical protein